MFDAVRVSYRDDGWWDSIGLFDFLNDEICHRRNLDTEVTENGAACLGGNCAQESYQLACAWIDVGNECGGTRCPLLEQREIGIAADCSVIMFAASLFQVAGHLRHDTVVLRLVS